MSRDAVLLSVLMADYNTDPLHLRQAVHSILAQTYERFELVIVDDGTINDLEAMRDDIGDPRIRIVSYGENRGFVAALNYGLGAVQGEYIARIDTDDWVEPDYLEVVLAYILAHPEFDVVSARALESSEDGASLILGSPGEKSAKDVMRGSTPIHAASVMRRQAILDVGGYPNYRRAEDLALWCELLLAGSRLCVLPEILYHYRFNRADYAKRRLRFRNDELRARMHYYPRLGAGIREYSRVLQSMLSGILPPSIIRRLRRAIHPQA